MIRVQAIAGALGAEVSGIDLTRPLDDDAFGVLHDALLRHLVLFFRDQPITPEQHKALARRFGPLQCHPAYPHVPGHPEVTLLEHDEAHPSKIEKWHTDMTFMPAPPLGSILHAQTVPDVGGDTLWANMYAAYEALSDRMQRLLRELRARHDFAHGFRESLSEPGGSDRLRQAVLDHPSVSHPVVRTHPETGRQALFGNSLFTTTLEDLNPQESRALLEFLWGHCASPDFTCRFRWERFSIAFWDNRVTQHKPINDYWPATRRMRRVTIEGDRPT